MRAGPTKKIRGATTSAKYQVLLRALAGAFLLLALRVEPAAARAAYATLVFKSNAQTRVHTMRDWNWECRTSIWIAMQVHTRRQCIESQSNPMHRLAMH